MRVYQLTDRDFEEMLSIIESIEGKQRLKFDNLANSPVGDTMASYRYYLIGWRNKVMAGDRQ